MIMRTKAIESALEAIEQARQDAIDRLAATVLESIKPFLRQHGISLLAGNGTFFLRTPGRRAENCARPVCTSGCFVDCYGDEYPPAELDAFASVLAALGVDADGYDLGSRMDDFNP